MMIIMRSTLAIPIVTYFSPPFINKVSYCSIEIEKVFKFLVYTRHLSGMYQSASLNSQSRKLMDEIPWAT